MSIFIQENTRLLVQGMGRMGQFHTGLSREYGTQVVGGVHPGKGGSEIEGVPIFNTVADAVEAVCADKAQGSEGAVNGTKYAGAAALEGVAFVLLGGLSAFLTC